MGNAHLHGAIASSDIQGFPSPYGSRLLEESYGGFLSEGFLPLSSVETGGPTSFDDSISMLRVDKSMPLSIVATALAKMDAMPKPHAAFLGTLYGPQGGLLRKWMQHREEAKRSPALSRLPTRRRPPSMFYDGFRHTRAAFGGDPEYEQFENERRLHSESPSPRDIFLSASRSLPGLPRVNNLIREKVPKAFLTSSSSTWVKHGSSSTPSSRNDLKKQAKEKPVVSLSEGVSRLGTAQIGEDNMGPGPPPAAEEHVPPTSPLPKCTCTHQKGGQNAYGGHGAGRHHPLLPAEKSTDTKASTMPSLDMRSMNMPDAIRGVTIKVKRRSREGFNKKEFRKTS